MPAGGGGDGRCLCWADIRRLALRHRRALLCANLLAILATLCSVPTPLLLPLLVDEVLLGQHGPALALMDRVLPAGWQQPAGYIVLMLLFTLLLRLLALGLGVLQARLFAILSRDLVYRLRCLLIGRLGRIALAEYEGLGSGTVISHMVTDLEAIDRFIGDTLSRLLVALLTLCGTAAILLWMHWQLALLILLFNPLVIQCTLLLGKQVRQLKRLENDSSAHFSQALSETLEAIQELRAGNHQPRFLDRLRQAAREVRDRSVAAQWKTDAATRSSGVLFQFGIDLFRAAAMFTVLLSDLSIGQMLAVFSYLWFMVGPVEQLLGLQYAWYGASAALGRINELLLRADEPAGEGVVDPFRGRQSVSIDVENLHFAYRDEPVLQGLELHIAAGERVAIVGASGGGKSTLVQLLLGLYQPSAGQIRYQGVALQDAGLHCVREHVAVVLQHPALFNDSLRANLTLGRAQDDAACWQALQVACLDDMVRAMPAGLDTLVGRSGVRLSGGQRQRLAIARMVLADPQVVILDEATSALDALTEQAVHERLAGFLCGRTTLIIAHRLSAVRQADRVLVFEGGRVCEEGDHAGLLAAEGLYARLYGRHGA